MDEKYYRPTREQLNKIVPKIESATTINSDNYVSVDLVDPRIDALEKRIAELENRFKPFIPITQYEMLINKGASLEVINNMTNEIAELKQEIKRLNQIIIEMELFQKYESNYVQWIEDNYSSFWIYAKSIKNGIGIHHGALPRAIQQYTVELFNQGKIKTLICTSTIIEGVNTVAENVIIYEFPLTRKTFV